MSDAYHLLNRTRYSAGLRRPVRLKPQTFMASR